MSNLPVVEVATANGKVKVPIVISRGEFGVRVSGVYFTAQELRHIADQIDALNKLEVKGGGREAGGEW